MSEIYEQLEKEKQMKQESKRITKLYKELPKEKIKVIEGLVKDASFLRLNLDELMQVLLKEGTTELFEQGSQSFKREKPEVKIYSTFLQRYSTVMKQLIDYMPIEVQKEESDELLNYLNRRKQK